MRDFRMLVIACIACLCAAACGDDGDSGGQAPTATAASVANETATQPAATATTAPEATATTEPSATQTAAPTVPASPTVIPASCPDPAVATLEPLCELDQAPFTCDFLVAERCLLPYPSSVFLDADGTSPTGFRLNYPLQAMPANNLGVRVDPTEWNTMDGFSPGPIIETFFAQGVDLAASEAAPITNLELSLESDSPTVLLDAETGERVLHFAELDAQASSPETQMFLLRPGVRLRDGARYIVALRQLKDAAGNGIEPPRPFQILRDGLATPVQTINARRDHFEEIFATLAAAGVERQDLILAWDFVTASTQALTGRALSMRDQGLLANGPGAPSFTVTSVEEDFSAETLRRVRGTFTVPLFMTSATPPAFYNLDDAGVPRQNGIATAPFTVMIPRAAGADGVAHPARPVVYGHGLLGTGEGEVDTGHLQAFGNRFNFVFAATDWIGMAEEDVPAILQLIGDLSGFPALPDRLQQSVLNFILLGRLMTASDGFISDPAFQIAGAPLIDPQELYFYGISQGGISGGAYMALSPDTRRGVLGVGAVNYSILLQRSLDFDPFQLLLKQAYPDELDRALLYPIIQQLWDRADPQGSLPHLVSDPLPGTPAKKILMQVGINDSQVPNIGSAIQARSLGIPNLAPSVLPLFGVPEREAPFDGSAFVPYDVNGIPSPLTNTPPEIENGVHEAVRRLEAARLQIDAFLRPDGRVENFCDGPCFFTGRPGVTERTVE